MSSTPRHIRIFLSSPGDVADERALALQVVEQLPYDPLLRGKITVEVVAWDKPGAGTPMLVRPEDCAVPLFDTAHIHAAAAADYALQHRVCWLSVSEQAQHRENVGCGAAWWK